jgi:hypothetical protein
MEHQKKKDVVDEDTPGAENDPIGTMKETAEDPSSKTANKRRKRMLRLTLEATAVAAAAASRQPQQPQQPQQQLHPAQAGSPAQWHPLQQQFGQYFDRLMVCSRNLARGHGPVMPDGQPMHWLSQSYHISIVFITIHCSPFGSRAYRPYAMEISWEEALEIAYRPERLLVRFSEVATIVSRRGFLTHVEIVRLDGSCYLLSEDLHALAHASWDCMVCYGSMRRRVRCLNHPVMQIVAEYM